MRKILMFTAVMATTLVSGLRAQDEKDSTRRLEEASATLTEVMRTPDKGIPADLLASAHCIVIVPNLKSGAFVVGAKYGKGYVSCRRAGNAGWSAPATVRIEGGSVGFQIGANETDLVMLVMNERGAKKLLESKFTLGGEGTVAAGPVGRSATAQTDAQMHAEILSWSRAQGLFAGISLQGATLRQDIDDNKELYGRRLENKEILNSKMDAPKAAAKLMGQLSKLSYHEKK